MLSTVNLLLSLALAVAPAKSVRSETPRPVTEAANIFAIYAEDWTWAAHSEPRLILALWEDGRALWSLDQLAGGPPYLSGRVSPDGVTALLAQLAHDGLLDNQEHSYVVFESRFTTMLVRARERYVLMRSSHELEEGTVGGLPPSDATPEYIRFRRTWNEIRRRAYTLVPTKGTPVEGELVQLHGSVVWKDGAP